MKKLLLILSFLLLTILPAGAVKRVEADPINVAVVLVEKGDSANIEEMFRYYGYTPKGKENGFTVMRHSNGNEMRYSFEDNGTTLQHPIVKIQAKGNQNHLDKKLKDLKFKKTGNLYERTVNRYNHLQTQCTPGPHNTLIFQRLYTY